MNDLDLYIIENYMKCSYQELANSLGISLNATKIRVRRLVKKYNLKRKNNSKHTYTIIQDKWLLENVYNYTYPTLCVLFNKEFNANVNKQALQKHCLNELGVRIDKSKKGDYKSSIAREVGFERIDDGYLWIKVRTDEGANKKNWIQKHRYVWEQQNGEIPDGYKIVFLDGDKMNCDISNLDCVPVGIQTSLNYIPHNEKLRRCKIASMRLKHILKEVEYLGKKNLG